MSNTTEKNKEITTSCIVLGSQMVGEVNLPTESDRAKAFVPVQFGTGSSFRNLLFLPFPEDCIGRKIVLNGRRRKEASESEKIFQNFILNSTGKEEGRKALG